MFYALFAINITLMAVGQIFFKKSSIFIESHSSFPIIFRYLYNYWFFFGLAFFGIATIIWIKILSLAKLSSVYPMQSLAYVAVAILSYYIFGEKLGIVNVLGIGVIIVGIFLVSQGK
jgi:drug/metabolite transporter (DMT)-like permease